MRDKTAYQFEKFREECRALREECRALRLQTEALRRENKKLRAGMAEAMERLLDAIELAELDAWSSSCYKPLKDNPHNQATIALAARIAAELRELRGQRPRN
jgi:hypothetical protein